jgi:hypothetical protein
LAISVLLADEFGFRFVCRLLPRCGISVIGEYNALRHSCQEFSAALRQKILKYLKKSELIHPKATEN